MAKVVQDKNQDIDIFAIVMKMRKESGSKRHNGAGGIAYDFVERHLERLKPAVARGCSYQECGRALKTIYPELESVGDQTFRNVMKKFLGDIKEFRKNWTANVVATTNSLFNHANLRINIPQQQQQQPSAPETAEATA